MEFGALILFIVSTSITPGPNNVMIMTSGVNHGIKSSLPHLIGIDIGFPTMLIFIGLGAGQLIELYPQIFIGLKIVGAIYLTYLAYKIASAPVQNVQIKMAKPFTFYQAFFFQWLNPKAWVMIIGAVVTFSVAGENYIEQILVIALTFLLFGTPCTLAWLCFGASIKTLLSNPLYLKAFNISMAILLMLSLLPVCHDLYQHFIYSN